jgi:hypothetical protein
MHISGAPFNGAVNAYYATDSTAMFIGDPVELTGESYTVEFEGNPPASLPIVKQATAGQGNRISGVIVSVQPNDHTSTPYRQASEGRIIWVCDDPDVLFDVQANGTVGDEAVGGGYNLTATGGTGSTVTGRSSWEMNPTTATGGSGAQLIVHRAAPTPNNDIATNYSDWLVRINTHTSRTSAAVVGDVE